MIRRISAVVAAATMTLAAGACSGSDSENDGGTLLVGIDLPMQGASKDQSDSTVNAMKLYLEQIGSRAGKYKVELKVRDDSTTATGKWDEATCAKNAQDHADSEHQVAVMGTYNSGCAKIEIPVLSQTVQGPMLMVSHGNTYPGLTKIWDTNEPAKYYPKNTRNYARVITTDDYQGSAAAQFGAKDLQVKRCYVVNDGEALGQGIAKAFVAEATKQGIEVLGNQAWDKAQPNYESLFTQVKGKNPDCVYLAGIYDNNGGQLIKDKVKVLGDNTTVKLIAPDGFTGITALQQQPEATGMYLTFAGRAAEQLRAAGGAGAKLLDSYKAKYGADPSSSFPLYGVQALQVILAAIEKSDGTRKGVNNAVFSGDGITIPADRSMLGKDVKIDPSTGDVGVRDISILVVKDKKESYVKPWPVS